MTSTPSKRTVILSDIGLLYAAAIWGSTFFIVKDALSGVDPIIMVAYRFLIAGFALLIYVLVSGRNPLKGFGRAAWLAGILWILYVSQTVGLKYTTASNSGFITGLFVFFIPVFLLAIFKKKPGLMEWIASAISLTGLWILTGGLHDINLGDMLTLLSATTYALHVLYSDRYMKSGVDPFVISYQQFMLVGVYCAVTGLVFDLPFTVGSSRVMWVILFLALLPTLSAFLIQMIAQKHTSPLKVSLIFALEPVFAAAFAWTLGGEIFVLHRAGGGLLIFLALIVSGLPSPGKTRA